MKSNQGFRHKVREAGPEDLSRRAGRLEPLKKSGKEKRTIYSRLEEEDEDAELLALRKKDSILDYFDDGDEE
ncbi:hypothetical protein [uncultured Alistipes sp.]|uniref:hypothetical protein n=1 Tax=uncultured Alistipes sp. TaxID=538949 RepID=UPI0026105B15|nr:hypothetical protein [uncultured Alistipes sp.]